MRTLSTILALLIAFLGVVSFFRAPGVVVFLDDGRAIALGAIRGECLMLVTNVKLGPQRAWTAQTMWLEKEESMRIRAKLTDAPAGYRGLGLTFLAHAPDALGVKGAWAGVGGAPFWLLSPLLAIPAIRARWKKNGTVLSATRQPPADR